MKKGSGSGGVPAHLKTMRVSGAWKLVKFSAGVWLLAHFGSTFSGWWFGTFFIFPYIGNNHPN